MIRLLFLLLLAPLAMAEPIRVIVEYRAPRGEAMREFRIRREFTRVLRGAAVEVRDDAELARLQRLPFVERVTIDQEVRAMSDGPEGAKAAAVLPQSETSPQSETGVVVAILDSGIDHRHPALAGRIIGGWDFVNDDADPMDDYRHGTHVAGIVAANGTEVQGIAPRARLLSYKVLNHEGRGLTSDIIAALDRALGDGADIINLSLGSPGHADDPLARAVNRAVDAGAVVVVAAGNEGWYHQIGTPGSADKAITVGATEGMSVVAEFSSRGPAAHSGAIKPDLLAPGVGIRSTAIGGGTLVLSGTSMATPHVAGLAALLLEAHPTWTPAQIKSALVTTARPLAQIDAMTQGTGVVDRERMDGATLVVAPTQLHFGLDATTNATWSGSGAVTLRNDGAVARTIRFGVEGESAVIDLTAPAEVVLAPGEAKEVTFAITVDNTALPELPHSFAYAGAITIDGARLPWAFLRAGRITVTYDEPRPLIYLSSDGVPRNVAARQVEISTLEALVEPAAYDVTLLAKNDAGEVRVIVAEQQLVHGDVVVPLRASDATHVVRFDGVDERGTPFPEGESATTLHHPRARMLLPGRGSVELPVLTRKSIRSSGFSDRYALLATEHYFDANAHRAYVVQHPPLRGLAGDASLRNAGGDYARQEMHFLFPPDATRRELNFLAREVVRRADEISRVPRTFAIPGNAFEWRGTAFVTPEVHPDFAAGVGLLAYTQHGPFPEIPSLFTPLVRRDATGFFATRNFFVQPGPVRIREGQPLAVNDGPIHFEGTIDATATTFVAAVDVVGDRGEVRRNERYATRYRITDANEAVVATGAFDAGALYSPLPRAGAYTVTLTNDRYNVAGRLGAATMTLRFDTTAGPRPLPTLTSLSVVDEEGDVSARLRTGEHPALHLSATAPVRRVAFRLRGQWIDLTPLEVGENVYRVDLTAAAARDGEVELRVELDGATWQLAPAFVVGKKRRAT